MCTSLHRKNTISKPYVDDKHSCIGMSYSIGLNCIRCMCGVLFCGTTTACPFFDDSNVLAADDDDNDDLFFWHLLLLTSIRNQWSIWDVREQMSRD